MLSDEVIAHTKDKFPGYSKGSLQVIPLEKGGSGRKFYRIVGADKDPLILVQYTDERQENSRYVDIASFLAKTGVKVPTIYYHEPGEGLIWMQDLGETDLWAFRNEPWQVRRPLYERTLQEVAHLHIHATSSFESSGLTLEKEFNEELYLWEQNYFFQHCLGSLFGLSAEALEQNEALAPLSKIAHRLAAEPRVLVHRDFQSQNILVLKDEAYLIDFQGMRPGLAQYDLASLLYDPYVSNLQPEEFNSLLRYYKGLCGITSEVFEEIFYLCALQRLMQALGAYGFLGLQKGKPEFLKHVAPAYRNLKSIVAKIDGLDAFGDFLETLPPPVAI
ncbi:MAG: phosphotransferase [Chthoniobacterales bacterium]